MARWAWLSQPAKIAFASDIVFRTKCHDALVAFLYHDVAEHPSEFSRINNLNVSPAVFEKQIGAITRLFNVITPLQLLTGRYDTPAALVTFDDGMSSYFDNALPIMRRYACPSIVFLNMGPVDGEPFWAGLVAYLLRYEAEFVRELTIRSDCSEAGPNILTSPPQLVDEFVGRNDRERIIKAASQFYGGFATRSQLSMVADDPVVYFGNHLYNHYNSVTLTEDELRAAYCRNDAELAGFPNYVEFFSYPFGQRGSCFDSRTNSLLLGLGAKRLFSSTPAVNKDRESKLIHRIPLIDTIRDDRDMRAMIVRSGIGGATFRLFGSNGVC